MPGHKGVYNGNLSVFDITEIPEFFVENLKAIENAIQESERNAAELFGVRRTLFSCSGSTLAISAMLGFCAGKRVTAFRNTHRSFIDAAILLGFDIDFVYTNEDLDDYITAETAALFVTTIDYYGKVTEISQIKKKLAKFPNFPHIPVLADNAHGAYLVFTDSHPVQAGAAMSADSAHKTLPALTGAAYLHIGNNCAESHAKTAEDCMRLFGTSSPSYLIADSIDLCNKHIAEEKELAFAAFTAVSDLKRNLRELGYLLSESDLLRVVIDVNQYGYTGFDYAKELYNRGVVCEMYDNRYVILLFSTVTQNKNTQRVFEVMRDIKRKSAVNHLRLTDLKHLTKVMSPREAYFSEKRTVSVKEAVGYVCGGVHVTVPPCTPPVIPGEIASREAAELLQAAGIREIDVVAE